MKNPIKLCLFACGAIIGGQLIAARLPMAWDGGAGIRIGNSLEREREIHYEYQFLRPGHVSSPRLHDLVGSTHQVMINDAAWP